MPTRFTLPSNLCICRNPLCTVPYGLCHCGCGQETKIATKSDNKSKTIHSRPLRFIAGHQGFRRPQIEDAAPFKIDGVYCRLIPLTQGQHAIVWESDYRWLMQWKWSAKWSNDTHTFYAYRMGREGKTRFPVYMAREIMGLSRGDKRTVDHKETCETLDNRRSNLRIATQGEQCRNQRMQKNNTSGYKGVSWQPNKGMYVANIQVDRKLICLGYRSTAKAAHFELYVPAAQKLHGKFARFE